MLFMITALKDYIPVVFPRLPVLDFPSSISALVLLLEAESEFSNVRSELVNQVCQNCMHIYITWVGFCDG